MSFDNQTNYENRCKILSELWHDYRRDERFSDFFSYNDLGMPLAHLITNSVVPSTDKAAKYVNEAFELLLDVLGVENDNGFNNLSQVFDSIPN